MSSRLAILASVLFAGFMLTPAHAAKPALEPMDVFGMQWADNPQISPDGRQVAYERYAFDVMKDRKRSGLWIVDADGRNHRPLTPNGRSATWSPDGKRLAYVASVDGSTQIQMRWMDTGQSARISELTESPQGLSWSPDGRWLAFRMRVAATDKPLASMPTAPKGAEWAPAPKVIDRVIYRMDGGGYVDPGYTHVFVVAADGGAARQITQGNNNFNGTPQWTRDGKALIVAANLREDWEYSPLETDLYRIDLDSAALTRLTERSGPDSDPAISPDGKRLAWLGFDDNSRPYESARIHVGDIDGGNARVLTAGLDRNIDTVQWDGDRGLTFSYDDNGRTAIAWVSANGGNIDVLASDLGGTAMGRPYTGGSMSTAAGRVAYTHGSEYKPADVAVIERRGKTRVLTDLDANLLEHRTLGKVERISVPSSADARPIEAWVVMPPNFDASKKYPLLLEIHGGPFAAYGPHFAPEIQLYAAQGYVVVYANPRGSTSYGSEFANLIQNAYPSQDYDDLMSVVDAVIARGAIDERNLFVTGGSGGGVLTAWIVGHTDRFRAAVSAKPVINWYSFVLTSDFYTLFSRYWFPGMPWDNLQNYIERSPIHHVGKVKTPTMMLVGDDDHRTPASEAEQFYQALKLRKVDTAMVRIPGASHSLNERPSNMIAQVLHTIAWFEKYRVR